jgi:MFS family permease
LFFGRTISLVGDGIAAVAIAFAVLDLTGSAADLGIVLAGRSLVMVGLVVAGGVFADRISPRVAMVRADFVRLLAMGLMAFLLLAGTAEIWEITLLYAIEGMATALFNPASNAVVPFVAPKQELQDANTFLSISRSAGKVAGPVIAGLLLATANPGAAIAVDAATFGASALFLLRIRVPLEHPEAVSSFIRELRDGWTEFSSRTWLWTCVLAAALSNAVFFPSFLVLGPTVAETSLGGASSWSVVAAAFGLGALAGGAMAFSVRPRRPLLVGELALLLAVLPLVFLASGAGTIAIAVGAFIAGAAFSVAEILYETAIQQHVPPSAMARVSGYDWFGSLAIQPLGFLVIGALATTLGTSPLLWIGAFTFVVVQVLVVLVPSVHRLESNTSDYDSADPYPESPALAAND